MLKGKGKFYIGKIKDFKSTKSYIIGSFMKEKGFTDLQSTKIEVKWDTDYKAWERNKHYHKKILEINLITQGWVKVKINEKLYKISCGQFYIIYPYSVIEDLEADEDTELISIKIPSLPKDKHQI